MTALARLWRPAQWFGLKGLLGQDVVAKTLSEAIRTGRVASGYLIVGPRGTGKTTSARILAAALNCPVRAEGESDPCGTCASCIAIAEGRETGDVVELDAATHRSVEDARQVRQMASLAGLGPTSWRVFILDECHMLTPDAWATLLKILEEPPARTVFIFCTTDLEKIEQAAEAILSRIQRLKVRLLPETMLAEHLERVALAEGLTLDVGVSTMIAAAATGSARDALSRLDTAWGLAGEPHITVTHARASLGLPPEVLIAGALQLVRQNRQDKLADLVLRLQAEHLDAVVFLDQLSRLVTDTLVGMQQSIGPQRWSQKTLDSGRSLFKGLPPASVYTWVTKALRQAASDSQIAKQMTDPAWMVFATLQSWCDLYAALQSPSTIASTSNGSSSSGDAPTSTDSSSAKGVATSAGSSSSSGPSPHDRSFAPEGASRSASV